MKTLLIANRGEIAIRIARTATKMGIRTIGVHSDADRAAPHVAAVDQAVRIGPTAARDSYLNIESVLAAAVTTNADAIHPGYGFLSERADFALAVSAAGLTFVGPDASVMEQLGRKDHARAVALAAGVPVVPGFSSEQPPSDADFPVLVKAAAGGGGKGIRVVTDPMELPDAIEAAKREASNAFGDDTILIETYVASGRHIEVQVFGDQHGNVVHLHERDCSAQRRHQKVLEEAPAPHLPHDVWERLTSSAVALARAVGYVGAGTVEFLVDPSRGVEGVYFLEMNTRLQVEHPVTEEVIRVNGARLDLVELQLRIATGEPLPFSQDQVSVVGHAIEARVYAEDAFGGFLPQAGLATQVSWPDQVRVDHALVSGQEVTSAYDPMLGKVIAHGADRQLAINSLVAALDQTAIFGLTTNTGFLRALATSTAFANAAIDTVWLDQHPDAISPPDVQVAARAAAAALLAAQPQPGAFGNADGWRLSGLSAPARVPMLVAGERELVSPHPGTSPTLITRDSLEVILQGQRFAFPTGAGLMDLDPTLDADGMIRAPMPGTILAVAVAQGDVVRAGQRLGMMEAMKMELVLSADQDGRVGTVHATTGTQVPIGAILFEIIPS
ncbi:MAG TPA: biotin carboxylase N-terminal domain-containing protein [Marmoricola sp.]|nr:biotin carboxylase N-terminal domain-containing protein [Marmoricola sp.]HNJ78637.1 biotin carboxylase N-terminal domain-containing protein [Marmoricola sp.]